MLRPYEFGSAAADDVDSAVRFYLSVDPAVALRFVQSLQAAIDHVREFPLSGAGQGDETRRVRVRGFPYVVVYRLPPGVVQVVAVAHTSRKPGYWLGRS